MEFNNMSKYEQKRCKESICPICKQNFNFNDNIEFIKVRNGRAMMYNFFHTSCLIQSKVEKILADREEIMRMSYYIHQQAVNVYGDKCKDKLIDF